VSDGRLAKVVRDETGSRCAMYAGPDFSSGCERGRSRRLVRSPGQEIRSRKSGPGSQFRHCPRNGNRLQSRKSGTALISALLLFSGGLKRDKNHSIPLFLLRRAFRVRKEKSNFHRFAVFCVGCTCAHVARWRSGLVRTHICNTAVTLDA